MCPRCATIAAGSPSQCPSCGASLSVASVASPNATSTGEATVGEPFATPQAFSMSPNPRFGSPSPRRQPPVGRNHWLAIAAALGLGLAITIVAIVTVALPRFGTSHAVTPLSTAEPAAASAASLDGLPIASRRLSPKSAHAIALIWFSDWDQARYANDDSEMALLETGAAYRADHAFTQLTACGCLAE
jgi:hypothetical protein